MRFTRRTYRRALRRANDNVIQARLDALWSRSIQPHIDLARARNHRTRLLRRYAREWVLV